MRPMAYTHASIAALPYICLSDTYSFSLALFTPTQPSDATGYVPSQWNCTASAPNAGVLHFVPPCPEHVGQRLLRCFEDAAKHLRNTPSFGRLFFTETLPTVLMAV